jgi:hypothetical protein
MLWYVLSVCGGCSGVAFVVCGVLRVCVVNGMWSLVCTCAVQVCVHVCVCVCVCFLSPHNKSFSHVKEG